MRRALAASILVLALAVPARAEIGIRLTPPVTAPVAAGFEQPDGPYGPGHRGIDYEVPVGTPVAAAGGGTVTFAGPVAGVLAVTVDHGAGIETTYTGLSSVDVVSGDRVEQGRYVGATGNAHGHPGLHLGVKRNDAYVDPARYLTALDVAGAIHLAPLAWSGDGLRSLGIDVPPPITAGDHRPECRSARPLEGPSRPPNDNVAVAVAGITSKTREGISADIYEHGPELLGYRSADTYRFSYAGHDGPHLHRPYERSDTYVDIRTAAHRLRALMREIARRHPSRDVDLIAHSQGGIVARTYLTLIADAGGNLPDVDHLVTFATPHRGAPGASQVAPLRDGTSTGRALLGAMKDLSDDGLPVPDPTSAAVRQLAPGSKLMRSLAREDVTFGTRVLALAIPNDPVVPADHALFPGEQGRVVPWSGRGLGGHSGIVSSPDAHGIAYSFLSDGAPTCTSRWDQVGPAIGSVWSTLERSLAPAYGVMEKIAARRQVGAGPGAAAALFLYDAVRR